MTEQLRIIAEQCKRQIDGGATVDDVIQTLHDEYGLSIIRSVLVIAAALDLSTAEAKSLVTLHPLWRDFAAETGVAQDRAIDQLQSLLEEGRD